MKFEIQHRWSKKVKIVLEGENRNVAIEQAIKDKKDLRDSDLRGSNLRGSNLRDSDLSDSDLSGSDLRGSDLRDSDLRDSDLSGSDLSDSDLSDIRNDLWAVLLFFPNEVLALREALITGKVEGSTYEGDCACLVGTIANARHCNYKLLPQLKPDSSRPAERFFLAIKKGDTPETNQAAKLALEWIDTWLSQTGLLVAVKP